VDLVISNCVLNLVDDADKPRLVSEIFRVLKPGGRIAIADIVSDRIVPEAMKQDPGLWSGCISGAFEAQEMLATFTAAGFAAVCFDKWEPVPWRVIDDIAFRSVTLTAIKPMVAGAGMAGHDLLYRGPFAAVTDDAGNHWQRGERRRVDAGTARLLLQPAYRDAFIASAAPPTDCGTPATGPRADCCSTPPTPRGCC
jgi:SAM-dependent methyltransferase